MAFTNAKAMQVFVLFLSRHIDDLSCGTVSFVWVAVFVKFGGVTDMERYPVDCQRDYGFKMLCSLCQLLVPVTVHIGVIGREKS